MPRDDEAPDPRHARSSAISPPVIVALVGGGLFVLGAVLMTFGGGWVLFLGGGRDDEARRPEVAATATDDPPGNPEPLQPPRAGVGEPRTVDGVTVRVLSARVAGGRPEAAAKTGGVPDRDVAPLLVVVEVSVERGKREYKTWRTAKGVAAVDDLANTYARRPAAPPGPASDRVEPRTLSAGETLTDTLAFEPPVAEAGHVDLDLPGQDVGVDGTFRFRIPRSAWDKK
jgi:hypothetical protein